MLTHRNVAGIAAFAVLIASPLAACAAARTGPVEVDLADRLLVAARDAAARHPGTQAAQWQSQAAGHDLAAVERRRLPRPSVALTTSQGTTSTEARLTQTLHDWGGTRARIDAAQAQVGAAEQGVREHERGVTLEVIEAWRVWAASGVRARAQAAGLVRLADYERGARRRGGAGFGSDADVALVRSRVVQARSDEASALSSQAAAAARLRGLGVASPPSMGADVGTAAVPAMPPGAASLAAPHDAPLAAPPDPARLVTLMAQALTRSATLARLRAEAAAADALARAAQADRFPVVNAVASHQRADGSSGSASTSRVLLTLEYAPAAWGGGGDTARAAVSRAAAARSELDAAQQALTRTLESEHELLLGLAGRWPSEQAAVASASAVLQSFERQFEAGRKSWLDVLNAARELTVAELGAATLQVELAATWARLAALAELRFAAEAAS